MIPFKYLALKILILWFSSSPLIANNLSSACGQLNLSTLEPKIDWAHLFAETQLRLAIRGTASAVFSRSGLSTKIAIPSDATGNELIQFMIIESIKVGKFRDYKLALEKIYTPEQFEYLAFLNNQVLNRIEKGPSNFLDKFVLEVRGNVSIDRFNRSDLALLTEIHDPLMQTVYFEIGYSEFHEAPLNQSLFQNTANFIRWAKEHGR